MKIDKRIKVALIIGAVLWLVKVCSWDWYYEDAIRYYAPIWVSNSKISFIKNVDNMRFDKNYPLYMKILRATDGAIITIRDDYYICTLDINNGEKEELIRIQTEWPGLRYPHYPGSISINNDSSKVLVNWAEKPGTAHKETGFILIDLKSKEQKIVSKVGQNASFSPDGTKILYTEYGIWTMNLDGTNKKQLTDNSEDANATWSPDGKLIAFYRNDKTTGMRPVFVYDLNSTKYNQVAIRGFINWNNDSKSLWTFYGLIDLKGSVLRSYPQEINNRSIPYGPISPGGNIVLSEFNRQTLYLGDFDGNTIKDISAMQEKVYGKINRNARKVIWIE